MNDKDLSADYSKIKNHIIDLTACTKDLSDSFKGSTSFIHGFSKEIEKYIDEELARELMEKAMIEKTKAPTFSVSLPELGMDAYLGALFQ